MPGPPPPSKSYLLTFDSSSEEDEDDHYFRARPSPSPSPSQSQSQLQYENLQSSVSNESNTKINSNASVNPNADMFDLLRSLGGVSDSDAPNSNISNISGTTTTTTSSSKGTNIIERDDSDSEPNSNPSEVDGDVEEVIPKKKRKKKRRKKKKKTNSTGSTGTASTSTSTSTSTTASTNSTTESATTTSATQSIPVSTSASTSKKVIFSKVHVSEFTRDIHGGGVPGDGGWPLSLSNTIQRQFTLDIHEFEHNKQIELKQRYEKYVKERRRKKCDLSNSSSSCSSSTRSRRKRSNSRTGEEMKKQESKSSPSASTPVSQKEISIQVQLPIYTPQDFTFETRQFDYKQRCTDKLREGGEDPKSEWKEIYSTGRNVLFRQFGESERKSLFAKDVPSSQHSSSPSSSSSSPYDELFCSQEIKHIRNELEQIRIHRSAENAAGCSCRKLHVVLPTPSDGNNKKSKSKNHHHRRLTERKVKDELRKRRVHFESRAKREELEQLLYDTVEEQGCCAGNDCPCARSGIGCQSDTCSCWHMSHTTHKKDHGASGAENVSPEDAEVRCGNRNGIYVVDFEKIAKHRDLICHGKAFGGGGASGPFCMEVSSAVQ